MQLSITQDPTRTQMERMSETQRKRSRELGGVGSMSPEPVARFTATILEVHRASNHPSSESGDFLILSISRGTTINTDCPPPPIVLQCARSPCKEKNLIKERNDQYPTWIIPGGFWQILKVMVQKGLNCEWLLKTQEFLSTFQKKLMPKEFALLERKQCWNLLYADTT